MSVFIEASAGTGKTTRLVQAIAAAVAEGVSVDRIAAVTYTHQAAGEMKLRVRDCLMKLGTPRALQAVQSLDRAFIGTIHAFCAALLRQRPVEACIDPDFREMDAVEARSLFSHIFRRWLSARMESPSEALRRAFAREAWKDTRTGAVPALEEAAWALAEWRDFDAPWRKDPLNRADAAMTFLAECEQLLAEWPPAEKSWVSSSLSETAVACRLAVRAGAFQLDEAEAELTSLVRRLRPARFGRGTEMSRRWPEFYDRIRQYARVVEADLAADLRDDLWAAVELYTEEKQRLGTADFTDLLVKARTLLDHPEARAELRSRFDRIFVDEFQDTDPLQVAVLRAIAPDDGFFVVGDPKQCIYRFRRADPKVYTRMREELQGQGAKLERLVQSWRSNTDIQEFVNAAFRGMADYLALEGGPPPLPGQPAIVALPAPRPYDGDRFKPAAVLACMPDAVAAFAQWLTSKECTWTLRDGKKVKPGDICILFRRATNNGRDLTEDYVRALEARSMPHVLVGSRGLHSREEVSVLRTALRAIEWPDDELSVYATLHGPLFGIPDTTLFRAREAGLRLHPGWRWPERVDDDFEPIRSGLEILADLRRGRNSRPAADTIRRLLDGVRGHAIFAFHRGGPRKLGNIHRLAELARQADARAHRSFRSFVEWLDAEAEGGEAAEAPVIETRTEGVRLMTAHKAKGLQFPVVILADPTAGLVSSLGCARWVEPERKLCAQRLLACAPAELLEHEAEETQAEREEGQRVAYVAATRAEDLLVVCAIGDYEYAEGWLSPLHDALYPPRDARSDAPVAPACPRLGLNTVLNGPHQADEPQVVPGFHKPRTGSHRVAWFDPEVLAGTPDPSRGAEREGLLRGDGSAGLARYQAWQESRAHKVQQGRKPSDRVRLASEAGDIEGTESIEVKVLEIESPPVRSPGRLFGRLLHGILEHGLDAAPALARRWDLGEADLHAAGEIAQKILSQPQIAAGSVRTYREYPLALRLEDGTLIEGRADLVRDEGDRWTVIDYKTGRDIARAKRQLRVYASALQQATGKPARGIVLEI